MKYKPTIFKAMLFGIVGGIFGSISMIAPKMISNMQFGMPYNIDWIVSGTMFGANQSNVFVVGILIHFVTGVVIGTIFGIITGKITKFRISKISRDSCLG